MAEFLNFYLVPGLVLGSIYALGAIGLSFTFGILRFANFSHGELMTLGVYFTWSLMSFTNLHPLAVLPIACVLTMGAALLLDRGFYKPLRKAPTIMLVIASFGVMLMLRSAIQFFWGVKVRVMSPGIQTPVSFFETLNILPKHLTIIGAALVMMVAVHLLLSKTRIGKAMRAISDHPELARLTGIDTQMVVRATWMLSAVLACCAGVFLAMDTQVETQMGFKIMLPIFAASVLGGVGKPYGAALGGFVIGIVEELSSYPVIGTAPFVEPGYKSAIAFVIMILMMLVRPTGLFKGKA